MKDSNPAMPSRSKSPWVVAMGLLVIVLSVIAIWWFHRAGRPASVEPGTSTQPSTAGNANAAAERTFSLDDVARSTAGDRFVTAMIVDSRGCLWAGSEGGGVRRFDPSVATGDKWTHFTIADGLGDQTVYALAVDRKGRIWAGHLNHGVSVFDGERWQNYDVIASGDQSDSLAGPLGERVFAIKVCPTDGDVWIATNAGLSRYSESTGKWTYYTRADGLSSDATDSIAFDTDGNIYVGTQADGINIASASDQYANWRWVTGPSTITSTATGAGLPTSQINDLLMTRDNIIYAATPCGLAWSTDRGKSWTFTHGPDWMQRLKQSAAGLPANWKKPANLGIDDDFITSLAMDKLGSIYLGYRQHGVGKFTHDSDGALALDPTGGDANNNEMVRTLPADMTNYEVAGTYGQAIFPIGDEGKLPANPAESKAIEMPAGAAAVNPADLVSQLPTVPETEQSPLIIPLDDDWRTQGTWMGRYGRDWAFFAGMDESRYFWGAGGQISDFNIHLGPHAKNGDFQRRWTATNYTVDVRGLEIPPIYFDSRIKHKLTTAEVNRRIGNVNDNGEAYPPGWEGPDLYFTMTIPQGHFVLSVYEMNDDGHKGKNALRDYTLELSGSNTADDTVVAPPCIARATDFYNGVYKRFLVKGPMDLSLIVRKNQSLNAEVSAIMLDQPTETPAPYFTEQQPRPAADGGAASQIDQALRTMSATHPKWWAIHHHQLAVELARWCQSASPSNEGSWQFASACYFANLFPQLEKTQSALGLRPARAIEKSLTWDQIESDSSGHETRDLKIYLDGQKNHP